MGGESKSAVAMEESIKLMITKCCNKDNKGLGAIVAELIRFGSSAKNKTVRKNGWKFLQIILKKYEPKKDKKQKKKPPKVILDALQTGLKQGLADSDKATQKAAMGVLQCIALIDESRAERMSARMSPTQRRHFDKMTGKKPVKKPQASKVSKKNVSAKKKTKSTKNVNAKSSAKKK